MRKSFQTDLPEPDERYAAAERRVKKIKGFYTHLAVYVVVNVFLFVSNVSEAPAHEDFFQLKYFSTALFWGLGLAAHGISVFGQDFFFGPKWEEKKIRQMMEKEKDKWE